MALCDASLPVVEKVNPLLIEREKLTAELLPQIGYPTSQAFSADLRDGRSCRSAAGDGRFPDPDGCHLPGGHGPRSLRTEKQGFLSPIRAAPASRASSRSPDLDAFFPPDKMVARLEGTLRGLGIDLEKQTNIRIDDKLGMPSKNPPRGVLPGAGTLRRAALAQAHRWGGRLPGALSPRPATPSTTRKHHRHPVRVSATGRRAPPPRAYAFLLEGLIDDPLWLADNAGLTGRKLDDFIARFEP